MWIRNLHIICKHIYREIAEKHAIKIEKSTINFSWQCRKFTDFINIVKCRIETLIYWDHHKHISSRSIYTIGAITNLTHQGCLWTQRIIINVVLLCFLENLLYCGMINKALYGSAFILCDDSNLHVSAFK